MYFSLLWLRLHIRARINISHLSIHEIIAHGRCYISHSFFSFFCFFAFLLFFFVFLPAVALSCLLCSACILEMCNKPNQFLIQIKVYFISNLSFCPSLSLYYYYYHYYFCITYYYHFFFLHVLFY